MRDGCKSYGFIVLFSLLLYVEHFHYAKVKVKELSGLLALLTFFGRGGERY